MPLSEILRIALSSIGVNKLRSGLTMLGITIGVFSVIGVMTTVTALRSSIETGLSFLGSNFFQFGKYPTGLSGGSNRREIEMRRDITLAQAMRYQQLMADTADVVCLKAFDYSAQAVYNGRKTTPDITLVGSNEYFINANQYTIGLGRNLQPEDIELGRPVVIIGQDIVTKLFPSENPLGKTIKMKERTYVVIGTFAEKGTSFGQSQDDIAIIPITRFFSDFGAQNRTVNIATEAPNHVIYNETMDKGVTAMRVVRGLGPADANDFEVYSNESLLTAFAKVADVITAGSFVISGIALLAAGVGIMNIMLVSVTERTKEIGIRKSIGARKKSILTQFLIEAVTISLAGGIFGIVLGIGVGDLVALWMKAEAVFPWDWTLLGLLVCTGIGIGFGFYPAWKAASLDPIEALRYE
ncbi:MAG TPA: ABC transporter permease [Opitutaceae bacterium]|nr:ABC transporter permease [Opitutaceae bacterium]HUJ44982.1 ABC transporter permease [Opitutaceae bacterium]